MSDLTTEITVPPAVAPIVRAREGIAAALLLSLALHAVVILGLSEWFEERDDSPSIVRATLARVSGPPATSAPPASTAEPEEEGPVAESLPDTRDTGTHQAAATSQRPPADAIVTTEGKGDSPESPWRNLDYAATVRQIANLDARNRVGNPVGQPRVRRIVEDRAETSEDNWYLDSWRRKVERIGKLNYPEQARARKLYGSLRLLVAIEPDGTLRDVRVIDSSGHKVLDEAAMRIVRLAAPYAPFPPGMRKDTDVLEIVRTWQFKKRGYASPA